MDELIKLIAGKTGISEDQARQAAELVLGYVKQKLPASVADHVDRALAGGGFDAGAVASALGGMFGRK